MQCPSLWKDLRCAELPHHAGDHHARGADGGVVKWTDADLAKVFAPKRRCCRLCGQAMVCLPCRVEGVTGTVEDLRPDLLSSTEAERPAIEMRWVSHRPKRKPALSSEPTAASTVVGQLEPSEQTAIVAELVAVLGACPLARPHTPPWTDPRTRRVQPGRAMHVKVSAAGARMWWADDKGYRYVERHPRGGVLPPLPERWIEIYRAFATCDEDPDSAVINWYDGDEDPDMGLGWHADRTEAEIQENRDHPADIITISLGRPAMWAIRLREKTPVTRCRLETGAITRLAGPTRLWEHTIERLLEPADSGLLKPEAIADPPFVPYPSPLRRTGRYSITLRRAL